MHFDTERKMTEYKDMLDAMPCGICQVALDESLTVLYANRSYYRIYGYTSESAKEQGFTNAKFILQDSDYPSIIRAIYHHIEQGEKEFKLEYRGVHRSGKVMWLLVHCAYDPEESGSLLCALVDIADRKQMEEHLRLSMEESSIAYQLTDKLMYTYDIPERVLHQPVAEADEFGLPAEVKDAPYSIVASGAIDPVSEGDYIAFYESILRGKPKGHSVVKKRRRDGSFGWYEAKFSTIYDGEGHAKRAIISCEDITEQREKELTYQKWSEYFKSQEGKTIGVYEYNLTKDVFDEEAGDIPPDYLKPLRTFTQTVDYIAEHFVHEDDKEKFYHFFNRDALLIRFYEGHTRDALDYLRKRNDGSLYWVRATTLLLADPYSRDIRLYMMTVDIDEEKKEELNLRSKTEHDGMTGLLNRETFVARVSEILNAKNPGKNHILIMVDIDEFKEHNDAYGHMFGDRVIKDLARFMKSFLRKRDLCGRIGGDEFIVFLNDIESEEDVIPRIDMFCNLMHRSYENKGKVSCSMGVAFYPEDGRDFQTLYKHADAALYEAKDAGRGNYKIYNRIERE